MSALERLDAGLSRIRESLRGPSDLADRYGLPADQIARYVELLGSSREAEEFLGVREDDVMRTVRVNTARIDRDELAERLEAKGASVRPYKHAPYGLVIDDSPVALAAYHEHLVGLFYIQGPASMLPVLALSPEDASRIADAASGVGGKATQISQHNPHSPVIALDVSERKLMALKANASRLGAFNIVAYLMDARGIPSLGNFDRVLLDAPCTGEGLMPFPRGRRARPQDEVERAARLQVELLESALKSLGNGGELVYSTCSTNFEENELVVSSVLESLDGFSVVDAGLGFGDPGLIEYAGVRVPSYLRSCRRFYPHRHNTEGFTICRIRRL
ncbi:MAG: RsmB/NOP family class I SAM-dependent RNA methyltransferase [Conexivisphaera sp.]